MIIKIRNGIIYNEVGNPIGTILPNATEEEERSITLGAEATPIIEDFVAEVNSGKFKPKTLVRKLEAIIEKHSI